MLQILLIIFLISSAGGSSYGASHFRSLDMVASVELASSPSFQQLSLTEKLLGKSCSELVETFREALEDIRATDNRTVNDGGGSSGNLLRSQSSGTCKKRANDEGCHLLWILSAMERQKCPVADRWFCMVLAGSDYHESLLGEARPDRKSLENLKILLKKLSSTESSSLALGTLLWSIKNSDRWGGLAAAWQLGTLGIELFPSNFDQLQTTIQQTYHTASRIGRRADADAILLAGHLDIATGMVRLGVFPTEEGICKALEGGRCDVVLRWIFEHGLYLSPSMKHSVTKYIARLDLVGSPWQEYAAERKERALSMLDLLKTNDIKINSDFADLLCAYGDLDLIDKVEREMGSKASTKCFTLATMVANFKTMEWYLVGRADSPIAATKWTSLFAPKIEITKNMIDAVCYWGSGDALRLLLLVIPKPVTGGRFPFTLVLTPACLNIAAYRGHLQFIKSILIPDDHEYANSQQRELSFYFASLKSSLSYKWAIRGKQSQLIIFLQEQLQIAATKEDLMAAAEIGDLSFIQTFFPTIPGSSKWKSQLCNSAIKFGHTEIVHFLLGDDYSSLHITENGPSWESAWSGALKHPSSMKWLTQVASRAYILLHDPKQRATQLNGASLECCRLFHSRFSVFPSCSRDHDVIEWMMRIVPKQIGTLQKDLLLSSNRISTLLNDKHGIVTSPYIPSMSELNKAAANGHLAALSFAWDHHSLMPDEDGMDGAVSAGHLDVTQWLIEHASPPPSLSALRIADEKGHWDCLLYFMRKGIKIPIDNAIKQGILDIVIQMATLNRIDLPKITNAALAADSLSLLMAIHDTQDGQLPSQQAINEQCKRASLPTFTWLASRGMFPSPNALQHSENRALVHHLTASYPTKYFLSGALRFLPHMGALNFDGDQDMAEFSNELLRRIRYAVDPHVLSIMHNAMF